MEIKRVRPAARRQLRAAVSRETGIAAFLLETGPGRRERCAASWPSRGSSAPSASSTGPRPSCSRHYFQAELSRQFDAWIWFEETQAVAARPSARPRARRDLSVRSLVPHPKLRPAIFFVSFCFSSQGLPFL